MVDRTFPRLEGHCPACGRRTLYRGFRGVISCDNPDCPNADAAHALLSDPLIACHVVVVAEGWTLRHPAYERIGRYGFSCELSKQLPRQREAAPDLAPGRYLLDLSPKGRVWHLTRLKE